MFYQCKLNKANSGARGKTPRMRRNTSAINPFDTASVKPPLAFGKLPASESSVSCRKASRASTTAHRHAG